MLVWFAWVIISILCAYLAPCKKYTHVMCLGFSYTHSHHLHMYTYKPHSLAHTHTRSLPAANTHCMDSTVQLPRHKSTKLSREPESPAQMDIPHSSFSPEYRQRSWSGTPATGGPFNRHSKQRSSLFIRLHRTSTVPQRLSILSENNTAPSTDAG